MDKAELCESLEISRGERGELTWHASWFGGWDMRCLMILMPLRDREEVGGHRWERGP